MKIFFDTEFTGLQKDTDLISIGLVSEDDKEFYAVFTDYDITKARSKENMDWLQENVIANLDIEVEEGVYHKGTRFEIRDQLIDWLSQFNDVQFVSDVCHYDFVLLIDLFGSAFALPENVCAYCHDINQDIADDLWISDREAFDVNREDYLKANHLIVEGNKHNSLYDARVIREIYENARR